MQIAEVFATNVRNFRKARGLSQERLGERAGLHRTYIGNIEQQVVNPSLSNAGKIADALGIPPAVLLMSPRNDPAALVASTEESNAQKRCERSGDLLPDSATSANQAGKGADSDRSLEHYALATFTDDGMRLQPIDVHSPNLTAQLLAALILQGCPDDDLPERYCRIEREFAAVLAAGGLSRD